MVKIASRRPVLRFLFFFPTISSGPRSTAIAGSNQDIRIAPIPTYRVLEGRRWGCSPHLHGLSVQVHPEAPRSKVYLIDRIAEGGLLDTLSYMYGYSIWPVLRLRRLQLFRRRSQLPVLGIHTPENFNWPFTGRQHQGLLEPLAHQPLYLASRSCVHGFMLAATRALVRRQVHGLIPGLLPHLRADGAVARN